MLLDKRRSSRGTHIKYTFDNVQIFPEKYGGEALAKIFNFSEISRT